MQEQYSNRSYRTMALILSLGLGLVMALWVSGINKVPVALALATTRQVAPGGTDSGDCTGSPCAHISYALTQAASGDLIDVATGTYTDTFTVAISVTIQGTGAGTTIVQAANAPGIASSRVVTVSSGVSVTLQGLTIQYGRAIGAGGGIWNNGGTVIVDNCHVSFNSVDGVGGGLSSVGAGAMVTITNGTRFEHNDAQAGGGIFNQGGTMALDNTTIYSNTVALDGGGILNYLNATLVVAQGTTVENNYADDFGGGIFNDGATLIVDGGTVADNEAWVGGGLFQTTGVMTLVGARVQGNRSGDDVGGIAIEDGTVSITATQVLSNVAQADGGGISILGGTLDIANSDISHNVAGDDGGGIDNDSSSTTHVVSSTINDNVAFDDGGGIDADAVLVVEGSTIQGNWAGDPQNPGTNDGGGIDLDAGSLTITSTQILSNTAQGFGGGVSSAVPVIIYDSTLAYNTAGEVGGGLWSNSTLTLAATQLVGNEAVTGGGVYHAGTRSGRLVNVLLADNEATGNGAGLYLNSAGTVDVLHVTLGSVTSNDRQAVYVTDGVVDLADTIVAGHATGIQRVGGTVYEDYNLFSGNGNDTVGTITSGGNSLNGEPRFADLAGGDYHLAEGSIAIDNGANQGVFTDFEGDARPQGYGFDIGYDESPYSQTAGITITKTADLTTAAPGTTIAYTFRVTNTGGFPLSGLVAVDDVLGAVPLSATTLAPEAWTSGVLTYTVVEGDLPGPLVNTVIVSGTPPLGAGVGATDSLTVALVPADTEFKIYLPIVSRQSP